MGHAVVSIRFAINNSTISGNTASGAGGVYNNTAYVGTATVNFSHSIVSGNTATGNGREVWNSSGTVYADDYNLFGYNNDDGLYGCPAVPGAKDIVPGAGVQVGDILDDLADNGGPTETHALVAGSPAIDAGNSAIPSPPTYDQRGPGFPRVVNGVIDVGAYEYNPPIGGVTMPADGLELLAPATGVLAALVALATSGVALVRRRRG